MSPKERREFVLKHTCWKPAFAFLPHTCLLTKKRLWLKWCYAGDYAHPCLLTKKRLWLKWCYAGDYAHPGDYVHPVIRKRWWADSKELMLLRLKGE
jgi:hypothetical protein